MANEKFSISQALSYGWTAFKSRTGFFIGLVVVAIAINLVVNLLVNFFFHEVTVFGFIVRLMAMCINLYVSMALLRLALDIYDTGNPEISRIGGLAPRFPIFLVTFFLYMAIVSVLPVALILLGSVTKSVALTILGLVLFVVPGFILTYMFMYSGVLVIDRPVGPVVALQESRSVTAGTKWWLFVFSLVLVLVNFAGMLCLMIGLLVTLPISLMASIYVYRQLCPRSDEPSSAAAA